MGSATVHTDTLPHTHILTNPHTHTHTHTHHDKLIAISPPPYYVVGADNNYHLYMRRWLFTANKHRFSL